MNRKEFFRAALKGGAYRYRHWVFAVFALTYEEADAWKKDPYPWRIVRQDNKVYYIDPETKTPIEIVNAPTDRALIYPELAIDVVPGDLPNIKENISTTCGDLFYNAMVVSYAFNDAIDYVKGKVDAKKLEARIEKIHIDDPDDMHIPAGSITNSEYLKFVEAMVLLPTFNTLWVPSASPKSLTTDPRIPEIRAKLQEENKDNLTDPAVAADITSELVAVDRAWVDDYGKDFLIADKSFEQARKKQFLVIGYEKPFVPGDDASYIATSLLDGINPDNFPAEVNSSREGSYDRGVETAFGGVRAKEAFRNTQNTEIVFTDCNAVTGLPDTVTDYSKGSFIGTYYIKSITERAVKITEDNVSTLVGKEILARSPGFCRQSAADFCSICMGDQLSQFPNAAGAMSANIGSTMMQASMKKMHATALTVTEIDFDECLVD